MNAAAQYQAPRTRTEQIGRQLQEVAAACEADTYVCGDLQRASWQLLGNLYGLLRRVRSMGVLPAAQTSLECYVADAACNLRAFSAELDEVRAAIVAEFLEIDEQLTAQLAECGVQLEADPADQERAARAAEARAARDAELCEHGRRLSDWRNPCPECRSERDAAIAQLELQAQMEYIRSHRDR